ncbi:MAG: thioredoxin family protein [Alphaproteobacteria bacterium]|nr:thioredoxin family protein [Alphaproteobacteria bacterium]
MPDGLPSDGLVIVAKRDCPTCVLVEPVMQSLDRAGALAVLSQDDPSFPAGVRTVIDDQTLERSFRLNIEAVPTLIRFAGGCEVERTVGWNRAEWTRLAGAAAQGDGLPAWQPGCGSKSVEPGVHEALVARYGDPGLTSREIALGEWDDPIEACFERGWSDGLPVVPPTDERILRMLGGTERKPSEIVGLIPPNLSPCTVEKVAINAVMAGCKPEYMPVVLGVLEAALDPLFVLHGLLCTTHFSGPLVIINGPATRQVGMNSGVNALGQGNRANATIGRALQLIVRNVGGGIPGAIDRATLGNPGKYTFCFAEDESDPEWEPLAQRRGIAAGKRAVTLFHAEGVHGFIDQKSRTPDELVRSLAMGLFGVGHPKLCDAGNAVLVLSPEHYRIFKEGGWTRRRIEDELYQALKRPGSDLVWGAQNVAEGLPPGMADRMVDKFQPMPDGVLIVRAGGPAGLFSAIIGGWPGQRVREECQAVTREIRP